MGVYGSSERTPFGPLRRGSSKALLALIEAASASSGQEPSAAPLPAAPAAPAAAAPFAPACSLASLSPPPSGGGGRTVAELRPRPGLLVEEGTSVAAAARKMRAMNVDVALVQSERGALLGILTDTDVARKLLAPGLSAEATRVEAIMTPQPHCIASSATAVSALCTMMERRFRHLPVVNESFQVQGVLDVAKCLHDAVARLDSISLGRAVKLGTLLQPAGPLSTGGARDKGGVSISSGASVSHAAAMMSRRRSGLLVEARGRPCVGIITPKDLLFRVVAAGLPADTTSVQAVMTPQPDTMSPSDTVRDALCQLQGTGYRTVPVVSSTGEPYGVLDILALMQGALHGSDSAIRTTQTETASSVDGNSVRERAESVTESNLDELDARSEAQTGLELEPPLPPARGAAASVEGAAPPGWWEEAADAMARGVVEKVSARQAAMLAEMEGRWREVSGAIEREGGGRHAQWAWVGAPLVFAAGVVVGVVGTISSRRWA
ncbi:hypothetical protein AB1Y20_006474 [Prymnesium parvum]|uniref:CBS domain-containing protein n=1 Tax=Prymnesium parvum TaxID=97485 RepID=A0AB34J1R7_PRYPA